MNYREVLFPYQPLEPGDFMYRYVLIIGDILYILLKKIKYLVWNCMILQIFLLFN